VGDVDHAGHPLTAGVLAGVAHGLDLAYARDRGGAGEQDDALVVPRDDDRIESSVLVEAEQTDAVSRLVAQG
jgi:hypothetical protein